MSKGIRFTQKEYTAIKKVLYFYNDYMTREYKQNGRKLPKEYDEENVISAEIKTRYFLGENLKELKTLYGVSQIIAELYQEQDERLTKAKEIIKKFSEFVNNEVAYDSEHPQEHTDLWNELCEQAEQFLKEVSE